MNLDEGVHTAGGRGQGMQRQREVHGYRRGHLAGQPWRRQATKSGVRVRGQVRSYCDSIANLTGQSLSKLYLVKGLQDESKAGPL